MHSVPRPPNLSYLPIVFRHWQKQPCPEASWCPASPHTCHIHIILQSEILTKETSTRHWPFLEMPVPADVPLRKWRPDWKPVLCGLIRRGNVNRWTAHLLCFGVLFLSMETLSKETESDSWAGARVLKSKHLSSILRSRFPGTFPDPPRQRFWRRILGTGIKSELRSGFSCEAAMRGSKHLDHVLLQANKLLMPVCAKYCARGWGFKTTVFQLVRHTQYKLMTSYKKQVWRYSSVSQSFLHYRHPKIKHF